MSAGPARILAIAHRAGNSLTELRAALDLDADVIEADVHGYRGRLEVRHLKTMGPLPWLWDRWELRSARGPRLELAELLAAATDGAATLMLDLKGHRRETGEAVAEHLRTLAADAPVLVCSRYWPALTALEPLPWVHRVHSARTRAELAGLLDPARRPGAGSGHGFSVHRELLTPDTVAALHRRRPLVMTWPVNDAADLESVLPFAETGTLGVISDAASILTRVRAGRD